MEGVEVPEQFASLRLASARVLDFNGSKLAQFTVEESEGVLMVTLADSLGLGGERAGVGRTSFEPGSGAWVVAGPYAFFLVVKDAGAQLDRFLEGELVRF
jgi:hypothetical protein